MKFLNITITLALLLSSCQAVAPASAATSLAATPASANDDWAAIAAKLEAKKKAVLADYKERNDKLAKENKELEKEYDSTSTANEKAKVVLPIWIVVAVVGSFAFAGGVVYFLQKN
tara:strand:+ start:110 stop:457 length:348 start_codon:yes stop_codon:yes gene_type:complete